MEIDNALILKLENLAKLDLTENERTQLSGDLNHILVMVEKLLELDVSDVDPLVYVTDEVNRLREDAVRGQVSRNAALSNAPDAESPYFKVPKIL